MPTILLQEIIDLLNSWKEGLGTQLEQALESLSNLEDNTDELETYLSSIDNYLSSINHDVVAISEDTASIDIRINTISGIISDINSKLATANNHLNNISSNTASVVTPVTNIKSNTDTLVQNSNSINANVSAVSNNIGTISANTGISATYTEATATNTGNILQKVTTMASDTTQLRADNQNILDVLDSINDAVQQIPHDVHASDVLYDPSTSGIIATNVQDAIDALSSDLSSKVDTSDFNAQALPITSGSTTNTKDYIDSGLSGKADTSTTYTKTEVDNLVPKYFDLTANVQTADSGISPFSYYAQPEKTDSNIHNILSVTVIDTNFNNPAIAVFYSVSENVYKFMIYSARTGNVKIRVAYN